MKKNATHTTPAVIVSPPPTHAGGPTVFERHLVKEDSLMRMLEAGSTKAVDIIPENPAMLEDLRFGAVAGLLRVSVETTDEGKRLLAVFDKLDDEVSGDTGWKSSRIKDLEGMLADTSETLGKAHDSITNALAQTAETERLCSERMRLLESDMPRRRGG